MSPVKAELARALVDEASAIVLEDGMEGLSLRKLAVRAGTSTMAVYTRFGSKPALLAEMRREGFRRLGVELARARDLRGVGSAYRTAALASPVLYGLMFGPPPLPLDEAPGDAAVADSTYVPLVAGVGAAVDAGRLVGDPERIALHLWSVAHGMVSLELSGHLPPVSRRAAERRYDEALALAAAPFAPSA